MAVSRREILASLGAIGASIATVGTATAEIDSDVVPDHVSITYDEERLERFQPRLRLSAAADEKLNAMYGYVAESPEWDYDVLAYWARYSIQEGWFIFDSHQYDHEPSYVFVDSDGDDEPEDLEIVVYTGYHHYSASWRPESEDLSSSRQSDEETHVTLDVIDPWHHYRRGDAGSGSLPPLRDWTSARSEWEEYGFYDGTSREAVDVPYSMLDRDSWWADGTTDARIGSLWLWLGLAPDDRDELDLDG